MERILFYSFTVDIWVMGREIHYIVLFTWYIWIFLKVLRIEEIRAHNEDPNKVEPKQQ